MIKANELRAPGAPVSLGALNLTLGGDVRATKAAGGQIVLVGSTAAADPAAGEHRAVAITASGRGPPWR